MKISVIVPSYNQAKYLSATLDSLERQRYPDLEVRVYDGGSKDGSVEVLRSHKAGFWWRSQRDRGQSDAINQGLMEASGDILAFLNSDDVYYDHTLRRVADHFSRNPDCQVLYGDAHHLNADGSFMENYYTEAWDYSRLQEVCFLCQPAVFWRREIVERFGVLDEKLHYALDYEYWLRIGKHIPFHHMKGTFLAGSRLHADTKTLGQRSKVHNEILDVVIRHGGSEKAVQTWLGHLAYYEACESENPHATNPEARARWVTRFVACMLHEAGRKGIRLKLEKLAELEAHLAAVGKPPCV